MEKRPIESYLMCLIDDITNNKVNVQSYCTDKENNTFCIHVFSERFNNYPLSNDLFKMRIIKLLSMLMEGAVNKQVSQIYLSSKMSGITFTITDIKLFNKIEKFRKNPS